MVQVASEPLRADARRNRAAILDAARVEFGARGANAQITEVAARAGVGVGTIYRHFATKEALMGALVQERFLEFCREAEAALAAEGPAIDRLIGLLRSNAELMAADAGTRFALLRGDIAMGEVAGPAHDELLRISRLLVAEAHAEGTLRKDFAADEIGIVMCGVCATMDVHPGGWRRHLEIVLDGLRAR